MSTGIRLANTGTISYRMTNFGITVQQWLPQYDPLDPHKTGEFKTLATLVPDLPEVTLAPGESTPVLNVQAGDLNADLVKSFLAKPNALFFSPAYYDLENAEGLNFTFLREQTFNRTARIFIDYGNGDTENYHIATNVDRCVDDCSNIGEGQAGTEGDACCQGDHAGVKLGMVLDKILEIPFETQVQAETGNLILTQVREQPPDGPTSEAFWAVIGSAANVVSAPDFAEVTLQAGDVVGLVLTLDKDGDSLSAYEELVYGTSDEPGDADTDRDGLNDVVEVRTHLDEFGKEQQAGWDVIVDGITRNVFSSPTASDQDQDSLTDRQEKFGWCELSSAPGDPTASTDIFEEIDCDGPGDTWHPTGTDPTLPDTDADGLPDNIDPLPLSRAVRLYVDQNVATDCHDSESPCQPSNDGAGCGVSWPCAFPNLQNALIEAQERNSDGEPATDVSEIWVAQGEYMPEEIPGSDHDGTFVLQSNVHIYGGFTVGAAKRAQRSTDPIGNGTVLRAAPSGQSIVQGDAVTNATLDAFIITGSSGFTPAVLLDTLVGPTSVAIRNCLFADNHRIATASLNGGTLRLVGRLDNTMEVELNNCIFSDNSVTATGFESGERMGGGAIYARGASLTIEECVFEHNRVVVDPNAAPVEYSFIFGGAYTRLADPSISTNVSFDKMVCG